MIYFDTSYLARLYLNDPGWKVVRDLAATDHVACGFHGKAETVAAFHRKFREAVLSQRDYRELLEQFETECANGAFHWLPLTEAVMERVTKAYASLPNKTHLRAADALHLSCAAENGLKEIYSNDKHLLDTAAHFHLRGINVI